MAGDAPNLALYRKYRPATFAEVKGQEHVTEPLRRALAHGRVHHAYLFSGPRGCGKTSSARILARSLNCAQGPTPDPCGRCESCVALAPNGPGSIDVIEIDAASHGGVDDARDLRERAFYAPVSGHFKIYIIDEAHMVTREGFNALLKLVEEPPPHLKFVFATTEPDKVIGTIRSRTHHYPFRLVPPSVLGELLEEVLASEGAQYEPAVLPVVIRAGAGSVRDTLSVMDQLLAGSGESGIGYADAISLLGYTDAGLLDEVVDAFAAGDGGAVFQAVDRAVQAGHDPRRFAADLLDRLRDLIVLGAVEDAARTGLLDAPADQLERMSAQVAKFGSGQRGSAELTRAAEVLNAGLTEMRGATSPRLLLELTCARVLLPAADAGDAALLARLERLERRAGQAAPAPARPSGISSETASETAQETIGPRRVKPAADPAAGAAGTHAAAGAGKAPPGPAGTGRGDVPPADGPSRGSEAAPGGPHGGAQPGGGAPTAAGAAGASGPGGGNSPAAHPHRADSPGADPRTAGRAGAVTAESIRRDWDDVLEAVKKRRRVSWILLSNARVAAVESGTLTVEFGRDGELKGFSTSGSDALLADVLHELYGVKWRIAAVPGGGRDQQESPGLAASRAERVTERVAGGERGPGGAAGPGLAEGPWNTGAPRDTAGYGGGADPGNSARPGTTTGPGGTRRPGGTAGAGAAARAGGTAGPSGYAEFGGAAGAGGTAEFGGAAGSSGAGGFDGAAGHGGAGEPSGAPEFGGAAELGGAAGHGAGPRAGGAPGGSRGAPKGGAPKGGAPKGGAPKGGAPKGGAPRGGAPTGRGGARSAGRGAEPPAVRLNETPADDEPDPFDDADADAELTGMELIQRELGGQIIGEIEDS